MRSTVISEPVQSSGFRYGYLGKTTKTETRRRGISEEGGGRDKRVDIHVGLSAWTCEKSRATFLAPFFEWISIGT